MATALTPMRIRKIAQQDSLFLIFKFILSRPSFYFLRGTPCSGVNTACYFNSVSEPGLIMTLAPIFRRAYWALVAVGALYFVFLGALTKVSLQRL